MINLKLMMIVEEIEHVLQAQTSGFLYKILIAKMYLLLITLNVFYVHLGS